MVIVCVLSRIFKKNFFSKLGVAQLGNTKLVPLRTLVKNRIYHDPHGLSRNVVAKPTIVGEELSSIQHSVECIARRPQANIAKMTKIKFGTKKELFCFSISKRRTFTAPPTVAQQTGAQVQSSKTTATHAIVREKLGRAGARWAQLRKSRNMTFERAREKVKRRLKIAIRTRGWKGHVRSLSLFTLVLSIAIAFGGSVSGHRAGNAYLTCCVKRPRQICTSKCL